jgi:hypothetical protein
VQRWGDAGADWPERDRNALHVPKRACREALRDSKGVLHSERGTVIGCCGHGAPAAYWGGGAEGKRYVSRVAQGAPDGELRASPSSSDHMTWLCLGLSGARAVGSATRGGSTAGSAQRKGQMQAAGGRLI